MGAVGGEGCGDGFGGALLVGVVGDGGGGVGGQGSEFDGDGGAGEVVERADGGSGEEDGELGAVEGKADLVGKTEALGEGGGLGGVPGDGIAGRSGVFGVGRRR